MHLSIGELQTVLFHFANSKKFSPVASNCKLIARYFTSLEATRDLYLSRARQNVDEIEFNVDLGAPT